MKRAATGLGLAVGLVIAMSGTAWAGEHTGNGGDTAAPTHSNSECSYSGLDLPDNIEGNPQGFDDDGLAQRGKADNGKFRGAQNYGQFASNDLKDVVPSPGDACNPSKAG